MQHGARSSSSRGARVRPAPSRTALCSLLCLLAEAPQRLRSQVPPSQAPQALQQALQQNPGLPDIIRQRILQSGLTTEQVRARLAASGYPSNLLDAYMSGSVSGAQLPAGALELAAIQALRRPPNQPRPLAVA